MSQPFFSVLVPVYRQWSRVPSLLKALAQQDFPASRFELLLVNNEATAACIPESCIAGPGSLPAGVRLLHCPTPGAYAARNLAVQEARGEWLVFTDADCQPRADWLSRFYQAIEEAKGKEQPVFFAGAVEMQAASSSPNRYEIYDLLRGIPQQRYVRRGYAATANLCVPASLARRYGFNAQRFSGGDAEFCRTLVATGVSLEYLPRAVVCHPARDTWQALTTKVRRVLGGQLLNGSRKERALRGLRSLLPPVRAWWYYWQQKHQPWRYRLLACRMEAALWLVALQELFRLLVLRQTPERR